MPNDHCAIRRSAADYIRVHGPKVVAWLIEQAEIAEAQGDADAAQTWREVANAADSMLKSHLDPMS